MDAYQTIGKRDGIRRPRTAYARLANYPLGRRQWVIDRCPFCGRRHFHGAGLPGDDPRAFLGDRCAHCVSPETRTYILVEA